LNKRPFTGFTELAIGDKETQIRKRGSCPGLQKGGNKQKKGGIYAGKPVKPC